MLNLKKGLAVALAAATVLTFAPVNASAYTVSNDASAYQLTKANESPVLLLTVGNTQGTVSYNYENCDTVLNTYDLTGWTTVADVSAGATGTVTGDAAEIAKTANIMLKEDSKSVTVTANPSYLRTLTSIQKFTVTPNTKAGTTAKKITVYLMKNTAQMNRLKIQISESGDGSRQRYLTHGNDLYFEGEAVPDTSVTGGATDIKTKTNILHGFLNATNDSVNTVQATSGKNDELYLDDHKLTTATAEHIDCLNLKGTKELNWTVTSNTDVIYRSSDESVATADAKGITAKKAGYATITVTTKETGSNYGSVVATFHVTVIDKPTAVLSAPTDLTVYGYDNPIKIGATGTNIKKNTIHYEFVYWDANNQKYSSYTSQNGNQSGAIIPYKFDPTNDTITALEYNGKDEKNVQWNAILEVSATGADGYLDPVPVDIHIHFQKDGQAAITDTSKDGVLDTYTLAAGKSKKLNVKATAASGAAVAATFESENADIATVDANGVVKAVAAGTTRIKVTAGTVTGYYVINVKPNAVAGVKVKNVKGAKVKVSWKAAKGSNVKYYVYKTVWNKKGVKVSKAGKTVSSTSTTLKVAKGYTVQVKVKAYVDTDETRLVGAYSATVAKTTDRK